MRYRIEVHADERCCGVDVWQVSDADYGERLLDGDVRETISEALAWAAEVIRREEERC